MQSPTTSSNHESTAGVLYARNIHHKVLPLQAPRNFDNVWDEFADLCGSKTTADIAWSLLQPVLDTAHEHVDAFDKALFAALRTCLADVSLPMNNEDHIVLRNNNPSHEKYAVGFARQVTRQMLRFPPDYFHQTKSRRDHCCVVFKTAQEGAPTRTTRGLHRRITTTVLEATASVELKTIDTNCSEFFVVGNCVINVNLAESAKHGALGQALLHVASDVLNCLTRVGREETRLPVVALAGKLSEQKRSEERLFWVSGKVLLPDRCGQKMSYTVDGYDRFSDDDARAKQAMSVYLDAMIFD